MSPGLIVFGVAVAALTVLVVARFRWINDRATYAADHLPELGVVVPLTGSIAGYTFFTVLLGLADAGGWGGVVIWTVPAVVAMGIAGFAFLVVEKMVRGHSSRTPRSAHARRASGDSR